MMTFRGAVVGCTPTTEGARGRARWRKDSVLTAMLGVLTDGGSLVVERRWEVVEKTQHYAPPRRLRLARCFVWARVGLPLRDLLDTPAGACEITFLSYTENFMDFRCVDLCKSL
jgi:hypothetical protein